MKNVPFVLANCIVAACLHAVAYAQATPAGNETPIVPSFNSEPLAGQLTYSLGASQSIFFGYDGYSGFTGSSNITGSAAFVSQSASYPTSFIYSGGYLYGDGTDQPNTTYQDFGISQVLNTKHISFVFGDIVSYLPSAPVFGLSGVPGVGDVGTQPIGTGGLPIDSILTNYGRQVSNTVSGSATAKLTASTSLNGYGDYSIQRFASDAGYDTDGLIAGASLQHQINPLNVIGMGYVYSNFTYPGQNISISTQLVNFQYEHSFSRRLTLQASAGPEWINSSDPLLIPSGTSLAASASLNYAAKMTNYLLSFTRGTASGAGVLLGTEFNNVNFTANHTFSRNWQGGFSANYGHATSLEKLNEVDSTADSFYTGVQATRRLGRYFSGYASYNAELQSTGGPLLERNAFSGAASVIGVGITYSPRPIHVGQH